MQCWDSYSIFTSNSQTETISPQCLSGKGLPPPIFCSDQYHIAKTYPQKHSMCQKLPSLHTTRHLSVPKFSKAVQTPVYQQDETRLRYTTARQHQTAQGYPEQHKDTSTTGGVRVSH